MNEIKTLSDRKFIVLVGEFGSGKSELAVNAAIREQRTLVDLDIAKPMNSSRDFRELLIKHGVAVVGSPQCFDHLELRVLPQMIPQVIYGESSAVFDVGGGDSAVTIGQYSDLLNTRSTDVLLVVNIYRPFSKTTAEIVDEKKSLETRTGLKITGIVCNCNLAESTDCKIALAGLAEIASAAAETKLPLKFVVLPEWLRDDVIAVDYPVYYLRRHFNYIK
ncbi:MAG: hypothetical protein WCV63_08545 [Negativicutes bacterium]|jgi:shikimate kinase